MDERGRNHPPQNPSITDPEFFEVFLPDVISDQMLIPSAFNKHFEGNIPKKVVLKDLSGHVWHVDLKQGERGVYLNKGWDQFVKDKSLKFGEFMVFRYNRDSEFNVRIFGISTCKKEDFTGVKVEESPSEKHKASTIAKPQFSNSVECPQFFKIYMPLHSSKQLLIPSAFIKYFKGVLPSKSILNTSASETWEVDVKKIGRDLYLQRGWTKFVDDYMLEFGDFLIFYYNGELGFFVSVFDKNHHQKPKATDRKFSFEVTMTPAYLDKYAYLNISRRFQQVRAEYKGRAKVRVSGKTWEMKVVGQATDRLKFTSRGWIKFVTENSLKTGDVCSFKLVDIQRDFYVFDCEIFIA